MLQSCKLDATLLTDCGNFLSVKLQDIRKVGTKERLSTSVDLRRIRYTNGPQIILPIGLETNV